MECTLRAVRRTICAHNRLPLTGAECRGAGDDRPLSRVTDEHVLPHLGDEHCAAGAERGGRGPAAVSNANVAHRPPMASRGSRIDFALRLLRGRSLCRRVTARSPHRARSCSSAPTLLAFRRRCGEWCLHALVQSEQVLDPFTLRREALPAVQAVDGTVQRLMRLSEVRRHQVRVVKFRQRRVPVLGPGIEHVLRKRFQRRTKPDVSVLSEEFLREVRGMRRRNLAVELLEKLLKGELATRRRKNVVQARSFAEMLELTIRRYQNRAVEAAQVIEELIGLAREMREANARGEALGLSDHELAFYDALGVNDSAVRVLGDETLRDIARELVETVRNNLTIDWTRRENVRANLRRLVKRVLRKHGYPPDKQESATQTVLEQAKVLSAVWPA